MINLTPDSTLVCLYNKQLTRLSSDGLPEISAYTFIREMNVIFQEVTLSRTRQKILNLGIRISTGNSKLSGNDWFRRAIKGNVELVLGLALNRRYIVHLANDVGLSEMSSRNGNNLFIGYSQSFQYAKSLRNLQSTGDIKAQLYSNKAQELISLSKSEKPIIMHVRLGDYISEPKFGLLAPGYFLESLNLLSAGGHTGPVWIFSNDPDKVEELFKVELEDKFSIIDDFGLSSVEVLEIMRHGTAYIISNSTFSWWAAFLTHNANAPVIAPINWFRQNRTPREIYPPEWVQFSPQGSLFQL